MPGRPSAIEALITELGRLPGVGAVTSDRLAYHLCTVPDAEARALAAAICRARDEVRRCSRCGNLDEVEPCGICQDRGRDRGFVLVVEGPRDVAAFEAAGHRGLYHVLHGRVAPLEGLVEKDLFLEALADRVRAGGLREVCVATNPDLEGEATAQSVAALVEGLGVSVTRIARGIPAGAGVTQVQFTILKDALAGRHALASPD